MSEERIGTRRTEYEVDFGKLLRHYVQHAGALLISVAVAALISFLITFFFVTPMYKASVMVYVNNTKGYESVTEVTGSNLAAAQRLVNTYVNIIKSDTVLTRVIQKGNLDCTPGQIRSAMTVSQINNTEMFTVSIAYPDPEMAAKIANTIAQVAPERIADFIEGSSTKIVDYAVEPQKPYTPSYPRNILLGAILGGIIMGVLLTLQYLFDMRLQDEEDITAYFQAPVLGTIPAFKDAGASRKEDL